MSDGPARAGDTTLSGHGWSGGALLDGASPLELITALCRALETEDVTYCHWKSNEGLARAASGEDDLDLLVSRSSAFRFEEILARLGFREAQLPLWKRQPGVFHSYALDELTGRLVHVHAHYRLVIGDDMTKNYHLPVEEPYLANAVRRGSFRVPIPEFEFVLFVIRMVLKHCAWDAIVTLQGALSKSERRELADLSARADLDETRAIVERHLPFVRWELWTRCFRSVRGRAPFLFRIRTAGRLHRALSASARRPHVVDVPLKVWRRGRIFLRRYVLRRRGPAKQPASGGALIGIVGGDGAGKSTVVDAVSGWLGEEFTTARVHLGKPPPSRTSKVLKRVMSWAAAARPSPSSSASILEASLSGANGSRMSVRASARLFWEVLTARDRYRAYRRARRMASDGTIVICDRFPLAEITVMDGAVTARAGGPVARSGRLVSFLSRREQAFYDRILPPDILVVLRVEPDVAVGRKPEERESFVRPRAEEIWRKEWRGTTAVVIDAGRPKAQVLGEVRSAIWSRL